MTEHCLGLLSEFWRARAVGSFRCAVVGCVASETADLLSAVTRPAWAASLPCRMEPS